MPILTMRALCYGTTDPKCKKSFALNYIGWELKVHYEVRGNDFT